MLEKKTFELLTVGGDGGDVFCSSTLDDVDEDDDSCALVQSSSCTTPTPSLVNT